jgi:hypothetical protein
MNTLGAKAGELARVSCTPKAQHLGDVLAQCSLLHFANSPAGARALARHVKCSWRRTVLQLTDCLQQLRGHSHPADQNAHLAARDSAEARADASKDLAQHGGHAGSQPEG